MLEFAIFFHKRAVLSVIIYRYLTRQILSMAAATCLILMVIFIANQFIHYLNEAASGKVTLRAVSMVTALQVPILLSYILPMSLFLGILFALGRLYAEREILVLSACGVSRVQLVKFVMSVALVFALVDAWLMLSVEPTVFRYRTEVVRASVERTSLEKVLPGRFQALGDSQQVLYVGHADKHRLQFGDVFVALRDEATDPETQRWSVLSSDQVIEKHLPGVGSFFIFSNGYRYHGQPGENDYQITHFQQYWSRLPVPVISLDGRYSAQPTTKLLHQYRQDRYAAAEIQWRVVNVLATLLFAWLAIPLSEVNPRQGRFAKILPGILLYVLYANMMFAGKSWIQTGKVSPSLGLWWVPAVMFVITVLVYRGPAWRDAWQRRRAVCVS